MIYRFAIIRLPVKLASLTVVSKLHLPTKHLSVNDVQLNTKAFKIVELQDDLVQFNTNNNLTIKAVNIYDLLGRALYQFKGENTSETYRLSNLNNTVYIAKVALSDGTVVTKKAVKK